MKTPKTKKITYSVSITIGEGEDETKYTFLGTGSRCKTIVLGLQRAKKDISRSINEQIHLLENE